MNDTTFDTLTTARDLQDAGVERRQAEAITAAMRQAVTQGVATKTDIAPLEVTMLRIAIGTVISLTGIVALLVRFVHP